jgi:flavin reductase (DIM6/NTAB) family NADH-FMN oxidoreductase RutF
MPSERERAVVLSVDEQLAAVMEEMPYGLYIVGSRSPDGEPNGMMADWVMQVAFHPRMLAVSFENDAHTLANIRETSGFTVNLLGQDPESMALAQKFAQPYLDAKIAGRLRPPKISEHHKMDGVAFTPSRAGDPVLDAAIAWVECEAEQFVPAGDHTLVIGRVVDGQVVRDAEPLTSTYTGWPYSG